MEHLIGEVGCLLRRPWAPQRGLDLQLDGSAAGTPATSVSPGRGGDDGRSDLRRGLLVPAQAMQGLGAQGPCNVFPFRQPAFDEIEDPVGSR